LGFLIYRVELKASLVASLKYSITSFLIYRVELKDNIYKSC